MIKASRSDAALLSRWLHGCLITDAPSFWCPWFMSWGSVTLIATAAIQSPYDGNHPKLIFNSTPTIIRSRIRYSILAKKELWIYCQLTLLQFEYDIKQRGLARLIEFFNSYEKIEYKLILLRARILDSVFHLRWNSYRHDEFASANQFRAGLYSECLHFIAVRFFFLKLI